jgi:hypothetical protein
MLLDLILMLDKKLKQKCILHVILTMFDVILIVHDGILMQYDVI